MPLGGKILGRRRRRKRLGYQGGGKKGKWNDEVIHRGVLTYTCKTSRIELEYMENTDKENENIKRRINLQSRLTEGEVKMVEELVKAYGGIDKSDLVRRLIQEKYRKEFPVYMVKGPERKKLEEVALSDEQFCEQCGGTVFKDSVDGKLKCRLKRIDGGSEYVVPVELREMVEVRAREMKLIE